MQKDIFAHEKHARYATTYLNIPFFLLIIQTRNYNDHEKDFFDSFMRSIDAFMRR